MSSINAHFYKNLHAQVGDLQQVLATPSCFEDVPDDWHIIVTDVENSTALFEKGDQQLVHLAATGSIIACLNIAREQELLIPFFFGGDGATLLVPDAIKNSCMHALELHQERCALNFNFHLRVGSRQVSNIRKMGAIISIAKFKRNELHVMPLVVGNGLKIAEQQIKDNERTVHEALKGMPFNLNLSGMECKWEKIKPPQKTQEVLSLIINAVQEREQHAVFSEVIALIDKVYGSDQNRNPVSTARLQIVNSVNQLRNEVRMKLGNMAFLNVMQSILRSIVARIFVNYTSSGKQYLEDMVNLTETLMIDGSINTVITGTQEQRAKLINELDRLEIMDSITYGYHISQQSVLSCYVTATDDYHIHFLDGEDGGYTRASKILKKKFL